MTPTVSRRHPAGRFRSRYVADPLALAPPTPGAWLMRKGRNERSAKAMIARNASNGSLCRQAIIAHFNVSR
jgi:hypothetical protein